MTMTNNNSHEQEGTQLTSTGADIDPRLSNIKPITTIDQAIEETKPTPEDLADREKLKMKIFHFGRALLNVEILNEIEMTPEEKRAAFNQWLKRVDPFEVEWDDEIEQAFIDASTRADIPIFDDPVAYCFLMAKEAVAEKLGPEVSRHERNLGILDCALYELQTLTGAHPFYISVKLLEKNFGEYSAKNWWALLNKLEFNGAIRRISKGTIKGRRASEFAYPKHPCWIADNKAKAKLRDLLEQASPKNRVLKALKKYRNLGLMTNNDLPSKSPDSKETRKTPKLSL